MTEQFFEELHALKIMRTKGQVAYKSLTEIGRTVIQRLLLSKLCVVKTVGVWYWKKQVYEASLDGAMLISSKEILIGKIKHEIAKATRDLTNKSKSCIRNKVEEVLKNNGMNLLSFMTLEMILKSNIYDGYKIGEVQFQHMKSHLSDYSKNLQKQSDSTYDLSYLDEEDYGSIDFAYELFYWGMIFDTYLSYQEDVNPEAITQEYEGSIGTTDVEQVDITETNRIEIEAEQIVEDRNQQVSEPVVEDTSSSESTSYESSSSYELSSYDSSSSDSGSSSSDW